MNTRCLTTQRRYYEAERYVNDACRYAQMEHQRRLALVGPYLPDSSGIVLELGCGAGVMQDACPGYVGIDLSHRALRSVKCAAQSESQFLPFRDGMVSLVMSFNTLEHIEALERTFEESDRVLKVGGMAFFHDAWMAELPHVARWLELWRKFVVLTWRISGELDRRKRPLRYRRLKPRYDQKPMIGADYDATASIDARQVQLWFEARGYRTVYPKGRRFFRMIGGMPSFIVLQKMRQGSCSPS